MKFPNSCTPARPREAPETTEERPEHPAITAIKFAVYTAIAGAVVWLSGAYGDPEANRDNIDRSGFVADPSLPIQPHELGK